MRDDLQVIPEDEPLLEDLKKKGKPKTPRDPSKKSARPSFSCVECTRRKIKCDKVIPCQSCCKRGKAAECKLADDGLGAAAQQDGAASIALNPAMPTPSEQLAIRQGLGAIRQRLYHVEALVAKFIPPDALALEDKSAGPAYHPLPPIAPVPSYADTLSSGTSPFRSAAPGRSETLPAASADDNEVEAAVTLEYLALGRDRKQDHFSRSELRRPLADDLPDASGPSETWLSGSNLFNHGPASPGNKGVSVADLVPNEATSKAIVSFSLHTVGWQHAAVHAPSFEYECKEFFAWGTQRAALVNQAWLALYFAVLCVGVKHMTLADGAAIGLTEDDLARLPKAYFDASVEALHMGNFLAKHSIFSVQAIVTLVVTCQDVGGSDLIATLLACGIRIAQHLNIHRFSPDAEWQARRRRHGIDLQSPQGIKSLIDREVRKRLWCALCTEDWVSIPYRRSYAIFPSHCSTPLPLNVSDEDLSAGLLTSRSMDVPTVASKTILAHKMASCIRRFFEHINGSTGLSYDLCLQIDKEINDLLQNGPAFLHSTPVNSPSWLDCFRHYFNISVRHKLLIVHRTFLGRSFRDSRYGYSRQAAINASRQIIHHFVHCSSDQFQRLWTIPYQVVAASTAIILDIFQSSSSEPADQVGQKRSEVEAAIGGLKRLAPISSIACRGVQLLSTLLAEEARHRRPVSKARKRKADDLPIDSERFGDVAKRVVSSSATGSAASSTAVSPILSPSNGFSGPGYGTGASPGDSDGSLTQDAFDAILFNNLGAQLYPPSDLNTTFGQEGAANELGVNNSGSPAGALDALNFWRSIESHFEPLGNDRRATEDFALGEEGSMPWA